MNVHRFLKITQNSDNKGVLKTFCEKDSSFAAFDASSSNGNTKNAETLLDINKYWLSENSKNSNFTIALNKNLLVLSGIAFCSCLGDNCIHDFIIEGSNKGETWENICHVQKPVNHFKGSIKNVDCVASYPYRMFKITHIGTNGNSDFKFGIRYLDLYGSLYKKLAEVVSLSKCRSSMSYINTVLLLLYY